MKPYAELMKMSQALVSAEDEDTVDLGRLKEFVNTWFPPDHPLRALLAGYDDQCPYPVWLGLASAVMRLVDQYADKLTQAQTSGGGR